MPNRLRRLWDDLMLRFLGAAKEHDHYHQRIRELAEHNEQMRRQVRCVLANAFDLREENERLLAAIDRHAAELARWRKHFHEWCNGK